MVSIPLGAFELYDVIGKGASGEVYGGIHRATHVPVAVKVMLGSPFQQQRFFELFANEVRAVAGLNHPNVVRVFDYGQVPTETNKTSQGMLPAKSAYIVMERASDATLRKLVGSTWATIRKALLGLLDGLSHAHARGVIHRDLKPNNVLMFDNRDSGSVTELLTNGPSPISTEAKPVWKLVDFGIAHLTSGERDEGQKRVAGTPAFMAPEQIAGAWRDYGPWTDLYALGCTVWMLVTGQVVFSRKGSRRLFHAHLRDSPPPFKPLIPVPEGLEDWLRRLLVKDPMNRYRRAADAAVDLLALASPTDGPTKRRRPLKQTDEQETWVLSAVLSNKGIAPRKTSETWSPTAPNVITRRPVNGIEVTSDWRQTRPAKSMHLVGAGLGLYGLRRIPMVGRETERDLLWDTMRRVAQTGRAEGLLIRGAAGTGKSCMAQWLCERAHELGFASFMVATHSEQIGAMDGLVPMVRRHLCCAHLERREVAERVQRLFMEPKTGRLTAELTELIRPLAKDENPAGIPITRLITPESRHHAVAALLHRLSQQRIVIVWLDDLQWGPDAARFAQFILEKQHSMRVLFLLTLREEAMSATADEVKDLTEKCRQIMVKPLGSHECSQLVQELIGLEHGLALQVQERSAGVPLFAVQLVDDWVQRGILEGGEQGFRVRTGAEVTLPDELHGLWVARLDHLLKDRRPQDRVSLELAAVLGLRVDRTEWEQVCQQSGFEVSSELVETMTAGHLVSSSDQDSWTFVHGMLVESLIRLSAENDRLPKIQNNCVTVLNRMGDNQRRVGRSKEAEETFSRSRALVETFGEREVLAYVLYRLAVSQSDQGRKREAIVGLERALVICRELNNRRQEGVVLSALAGPYRQMSQIEEALRLYDEALVIHREVGNREFEGIVLGNLALLHMDLGRIEKAHALYEEALVIHREMGNRRSQGIVLGNLGSLHKNLGRLDEAWDAYQEALDTHREVGNRRHEGSVLCNLALLHNSLGEIETAQSLFEEALIIHREVGNRRQEAIVLGNLGDLALEQGLLADACENLKAAIEIAKEIDSKIVEGVFLGSLAEVELRLGNVDLVSVLLDQSERFLRDSRNRIEIGKFLCRKTRIFLLLGNLDEAKSAHAEAREISSELGIQPHSELAEAISKSEHMLCEMPSSLNQCQESCPTSTKS